MAWFDSITGRNALEKMDATVAEMEQAYVALATRVVEIFEAERRFAHRHRAMQRKLTEVEQLLHRAKQAEALGGRQDRLEASSADIGGRLGVVEAQLQLHVLHLERQGRRARLGLGLLSGVSATLTAVVIWMAGA